MQADMVLEKELRVLRLDLKQQEVNCVTGCGLSIYETLKPASTVTPFLQQGHTYSNKVAPCVTPYDQALKHMTIWGPF